MITKVTRLGKMWLILLFFVAVALYLYKLDYEYFFVDEIVYIQSGKAFLSGDFSLSREVPPLGKYIAGGVHILFGNNVFLMRTPFALMTVFSGLVVFLILRSFFNDRYALFGAFVFLFSPFVFGSSRMVMLEPIVLLVWLLFHFFYIKFLRTENVGFALLTGVFIGLSLAVKVTSLFVILPFFVVTFAVFVGLGKKQLYKLLLIISSSLSAFLLPHMPILFKEGFGGIVIELQRMKDTYYTFRDQAGKLQVVGGVVYEHSPWWYYLYFTAKEYFPVSLVVVLVSPVVIFLKRNFYTIYWGLFLLVDLAFFQALGVKAERYISALELPLVFLTIAFFHTLISSRGFRIIGTALLICFCSLLIISRVNYLWKLQPTKYNALIKYLTKETNNFTNGERALVYGSIRSGRWVAEESSKIVTPAPVITRKDDILRCEYDEFDYIVIDPDERLIKGKHSLFDFVKRNRANYRLTDVGGLFVYNKSSSPLKFVKDFDCP